MAGPATATGYAIQDLCYDSKQSDSAVVSFALQAAGQRGHVIEHMLSAARMSVAISSPGPPSEATTLSNSNTYTWHGLDDGIART